MHKHEILDFLKEFKESHINVFFSEIGLFGSYAKDNADEYSDIDVGIKIKPDFLKEHDAWDYFDALKKIQNAIYQKFRLKSDIFDLDSDSPIKNRIDKEIIYV